MRRRKYKYFAFLCILVYTYYFFGIHDYLNTKDFDETFNYPLNIDLNKVAKRILGGEKPGVTPINYYPYRFLTNSAKCGTVDQMDLFIVVKSAMNHFGHRMAIRKTYGQEDVIPGKIVKTLFFLGVERKKTLLQNVVDKEIDEYKDIIQMNFIDNYYNNTIKTMMSFRWVYEHCSTADFYLFTDDDMYISVKNLLDYVNKPVVTENPLLERDRNTYMSKLNELEEDKYKLHFSKPHKLDNSKEFENKFEQDRDRSNLDLQELKKDSKIDISKFLTGVNLIPKRKRDRSQTKQVLERERYNDIITNAMELKRDTYFYAGYVFKSAPLRLISSKWRVSLEEYPWNRWPDYVTAGAYTLSNKAMKTMYVASLFVKHFKFDDIYLGIVAKKLGIKPVHCADFYYYKKIYTKDAYKDVIASHGFADHEELLRVWYEQNGNGRMLPSP
ncbi:hypothetical protein K1T71_006966 [Dendrolimus kikuchii]|uniref:Uncharacterized protein n=1 Tax=Dendrolimus kikuchii TaxID=765133 RepID=A0ACC1CZD2_9NEOP|nr:hypothetical protein K1T71_006966 [Dendrolimus kikuchii]